MVEEIDKGDYVRQKIILRTGPYSLMPMYLLLPKHGDGPLPVVLAFHGHGYGVKDIVGLWEDGRERNTPDGYHKDFAVDLCRAGFAVAAPEISCRYPLFIEPPRMKIPESSAVFNPSQTNFSAEVTFFISICPELHLQKDPYGSQESP